MLKDTTYKEVQEGWCWDGEMEGLVTSARNFLKIKAPDHPICCLGKEEKTHSCASLCLAVPTLQIRSHFPSALTLGGTLPWLSCTISENFIRIGWCWGIISGNTFPIQTNGNNYWVDFLVFLFLNITVKNLIQVFKMTHSSTVEDNFFFALI